jgi:hypothetical protein
LIALLLISSSTVRHFYSFARDPVNMGKKTGDLLDACP